MEPYSPEAPQPSSSSGSPAVSSDSPGTATSSGLSATNDGRHSQQPAPPSVPAACLACRGKHLKCDGLTPCGRCTSSNQECVYIASRRGYKGPGRNKVPHNPHKRHASSSPPYVGGADSCPMLLGHSSSVAASGIPAFPAFVMPAQSPAPYVANTPAMSSVSLFRSPFAPNMAPNGMAPNGMTPKGMAPNGMALATVPAAAPPAQQPPALTLPERCFDAFYHYFHGAHPFVLPKPYFLRLLKDGTSPNLEVVMAAMRYVGSLFIDCGPARATYLDEALRLCYLPTTPKDGFLIQALMLIMLGLDGSCELGRARELLADCERLAVEIDLNKREFATLHGQSNPVMEESWRRTWWDLYVIDGMIAGVHRATNFLLYDIPADVGLPCEEHQYRSGRIPPLSTMEDFDDQLFSGEEREFSSFAYRISAIRNLGRMMRMPNMGFPDDENIARIEALLTNWRIHLPDNKRDDLTKNCKLDEMMFQAHFINYACTIMLHQPLSQLDTSPASAVNSCAPHRPVQTGDHFNAHTRHTITAACEVSKMVTQAVPLMHHTHFFTCVVTLSSIVHLSKWALYFLDDEEDLRQQIRLNIGALGKLSKVWKSAGRAWGQVKGVAQDIYREKKAHQISPAFWVGFTQEQMIQSINADEGIMSDFNILGQQVVQQVTQAP